MASKKEELSLTKLASLTKDELLLEVVRLHLSDGQRFDDGPKKPPSPDDDSKKPPPKSDTTDWTKVFHTCPRCEKSKPVDPGFGTRINGRGKVYRQSYCLECRNDNSYYYKRKSRSAAKTGRGKKPV